MYLQSMTATFSHTLWYTAGTVLTLDDFRAVYEALRDVRYKWQLIGIQLHLSFSDLEDLQNNYSYRDSDQRLTQMIGMWLRKSDPRPTWEALINALRSSPVNAEFIAYDIEKKYLKQIAGMWVVNYFIPQPQALDIVLYLSSTYMYLPYSTKVLRSIIFAVIRFAHGNFAACIYLHVRTLHEPRNSFQEMFTGSSVKILSMKIWRYTVVHFNLCDQYTWACDFLGCA